MARRCCAPRPPSCWYTRSRSGRCYLRRFPIDKLKIDRSFIAELTNSRTDQSIVRAIIALAHCVGLQVVAEGVKTEAQLQCVRALGCDQWQGYYCCPPQSRCSPTRWRRSPEPARRWSRR